MVDDVSELKHELIRESLRKVGITHGVEVTTMGDIPSQGSGLGSSSTVTVGSLQSMYSYIGELVPAERLAREACEIELGTLARPIGIQDQYIAAYGGLRFMEFAADGKVHPHKLRLSSDSIRALNDELLLFYTGKTRSSSSILKEQKSNIEERCRELTAMKELVHHACDELMKENVEAIGELLHESWILKRQLASQVSNGFLDDLYTSARDARGHWGKSHRCWRGRVPIAFLSVSETKKSAF